MWRDAWKVSDRSENINTHLGVSQQELQEKERTWTPPATDINKAGVLDTTGSHQVPASSFIYLPHKTGRDLSQTAFDADKTLSIKWYMICGYSGASANGDHGLS